MTENTETARTTEDQQEAAKLWPSPGEMLRKIREEKGFSREKVAEALHMTVRYVRALEEDDYDFLPAMTFVKGYCRSYARFLAADVDAVMHCYEQYVGAMDKKSDRQQETRRFREQDDQHKLWLLVSSIIVVLLIGIGWWTSTRADSVDAITDIPEISE